MRRLALIVFIAASAPVWAGEAAPAAEPAISTDIVNRYVSAVQEQKTRRQAVSMDVEIDAELPRLKKSGRLRALRFIPKVGQVVYDALRFEGDNTVKKEVIARYLTAEKQAQDQYAGDIAITPANYKFKYKGTADYAGRTAHVFQLSPRKKRLGLFKGELWVDSETYLPLREWGELVKNPSVFLRSVYFVRDYFIVNGISIPRRVISDVDTRVVGPAQLTIWFDNFNLNAPKVTTAANAAGPSMAGRYGN